MKSDGVILVTFLPANAFFFLLLVLLVLSYLLWSMYVCSIIRQFFISPLLLLLFCGLWFSMQRPGSILPYMYMMSVLYHQYRTAGGGGASGKIIYKYIFLRGLMIKEEKSHKICFYMFYIQFVDHIVYRLTMEQHIQQSLCHVAHYTKSSKPCLLHSKKQHFADIWE